MEIIKKPLYSEMIERGFHAPHLFAQDFLDIECHAGQIAWLNRANFKDPKNPRAGLEIRKPKAREGILSASNRFGKTYVAAIKQLWMAFYQIRPEDFKYDPVTGELKTYRTVNVAMSLDQAMLVHNFASGFANRPRFRRYIIDQKGTPFPQLVLGVESTNSNHNWRSEVWARSTAKNARFLLGHTFNFINWDEAAFDIALNQEQVLDQVIRARVWDQGGAIDFTSSPNGYNRFKEIWELGQSSHEYYYSMSGDVFMNYNPRTGKPNIDFEAIKRSMVNMHEDWQLQNIWGLFAKLNNIFPVNVVQQCYVNQENLRWKGQFVGEEGLDGMILAPQFTIEEYKRDNGAGVDVEVSRPKAIDTPQRYVIGADLGRKKDFTCIVVLQLPEHGKESSQPLRVVYFEMINRMKWKLQFAKIRRLSQIYNNATVRIDATAQGGDMAMESLADDFDFGEDVEGTQFSNVSKTNLILLLQDTLQQRQVVFPFIYELYNQLIYYQWDDKKLQTDAVFGLALAVQQAKEVMGDAFERISAPEVPLYVIYRDPATGAIILPTLEETLEDNKYLVW